MRASVVGLGKIGLPLAVQIARSGVEVVGVDVNSEVNDLVNLGREPFPGEANLADYLIDVVSRRLLRATNDFADAIPESDVIIVVVPVVVDAEARPDFTAIDAATSEIGCNLSAGTLVSYETTLPVHTTRRRFVPALESASGLTAGENLFVCHSPERVLTGRVFTDLRRYPKLVGGVDPVSAERAVAFYERVLDFDDRPDLDRRNGVWDLGGAEAAELAKLAETTYRNINIAFANQLAMHADEIGIDIAPVIEASNSQPYSHIHQPGVAVGGHCIPVYPKFYLSVDQEAAVPAAAIRVNEAMPRYVVDQVCEQIGDLTGQRAAILGVTYRGGVKETAFSGAFPLAEELRRAGADVVAHDPMYNDSELVTLGFEPYELGSLCDVAIIQADHDRYRQLSGADVPGAVLVYDGRRIIDRKRFDGTTVLMIGDGDR